MDTLLVASDENVKQNPNMDLAQQIYSYDYFQRNKNATKALEFQLQIMKNIEADFMAPLYHDLCSRFNWQLDSKLHDSMKEKIDELIKKADTAKAVAIESAGDTEVLDAMFEKARVYSRVGDWTTAFSVYEEIMKTPKITSNKKIDAMCDQARIALWIQDLPRLKSLIDDTKKLNETAGDWDRRNRLKIYEALYLLFNRDIKKAAPLLLDCIETFTCVELISYNTFMLYAVIANINQLSRVELHTKVIKNPQVIAMIKDIPHLESLLHSIYECDYAAFFRSLIAILPTIEEDRYLGPQLSTIVREYRILAYGQYLEAYKSVMLSTMAKAFGMSPTMLDNEISKFIASGRVMAKIDKVGDMVENTKIYDKKNTQYQEIVRKGDVVLNQIQKLARTLDM